MSLERKDVRAKIEADIHAGMVALCEREGIEHGEFLERLIVREVRLRFHEAIELARIGERLGLSGSLGDRRGVPPVRR